MIEFVSRDAGPDQIRHLLRKLRDLNLSAEPVAITRTSRVTITGCLSLDAPAENGVRYRLERTGGVHEVLELAWHATGLALSLHGRRAQHSPKKLSVRLSRDPEGRVFSRELAARVSPDSCDPRALAHFLRRVVRTLCRD